MSKMKLMALAVLVSGLALSTVAAQAQVISNWGWGGWPGPSQFPNSWGWQWGRPVGSIYGSGPYGGFGYFSPYGVYEYSFKNPMQVTGEMAGWVSPYWY